MKTEPLFIELTNQDGRKIFVNLDNVVRFSTIKVKRTKYADDEDTVGADVSYELTKAYLTTDQTVEVMETMDQINALILVRRPVPSLSEMVQVIQNTDPAIIQSLINQAADTQDQGHPAGDLIEVTITPKNDGADRIFRLLREHGIGCAWMGESGYFIVQAYDPGYFITWVTKELDARGIQAQIEEGEPFK